MDVANPSADLPWPWLPYHGHGKSSGGSAMAVPSPRGGSPWQWQILWAICHGHGRFSGGFAIAVASPRGDLPWGTAIASPLCVLPWPWQGHGEVCHHLGLIRRCPGKSSGDGGGGGEKEMEPPWPWQVLGGSAMTIAIPRRAIAMAMASPSGELPWPWQSLGGNCHDHGNCVGAVAMAMAVRNGPDKGPKLKTTPKASAAPPRTHAQQCRALH